MPLLCISLLVLLLLPFSLCCDSKKTMTEIQDGFRVIVQIYMNNTRGKIAERLQNKYCPEKRHKPPSCTTEKADIVETLLIQACEMKRLRETEILGKTVQQTIDCPCPVKPTKDPSERLQRRRRRKPKKQQDNSIKKLCKANAILSSMTVCYEILNSMDV